MFTGLVETLGRVEAITASDDSAQLHIHSPAVLDGVAIGDSISVNGCCLTVTAHDGDSWRADLMRTTLEATALGRLTADDPVNLERAVRADARLGGHIVQGHVDAVGTIVDRERTPDWDLLRVSVPPALWGYIAPKGSIAIDGVSLTVVSIEDGTITLSLVPHTLAHTTLGTVKLGDPVNIEVDVLAKYVESLLNRKAS